VSSAHSQTQYQVRFDWGIPGSRAIGETADVIVWVDALQVSPREQQKPDGLVVAGSLRDRRAVADWVLTQQGDKGDRFTVAVVAAGEPREDGSLRFALEDLLAAGAVIEALADVGIDYCAPEAAAASAAYTGLVNATGHLIGSSASGRELTEAGRRAEVDHAIDRDTSSEVTILSRS
jgi:2-phosphosulfolactate phosphatase